MPRKPNTDCRRAEIITALQAVIARQGYEKASIQAIAKEAGLAPGLIHYHFKNKQEILVLLVRKLADYGQQRFEQIAAQAGSPEARLHAYLEARLGLGEGAAPDAVAAWVMIGAEAVRQKEVRDIYQQAVAQELLLLTALLGECLIAQGSDAGKAAELAAGLLAMMAGAYQLSSSAGSVMPVGYAAHAAKTYARLYLDAVPTA
ncbi:TetR family transcriptional regulator [Chitinimonas viridis]|uniref:TetR family transcriptional regulator n=1 Tax=Chitinimonas viridis TaxID=664880 RepID=A0ABT8B7V9_9NEIS|nr:TetR family transcriptional regulator [Chitinimonas viridis]MDN3578348.1 TetR family transcriptional regulator [Chitinimonas viridis]